MYFVYAIYSLVDNRIYVGFCKNVELRLKEHNSGKTKSTKGFVPWKLFYLEEAESKAEARYREKYFKSGIGKEKLRFILDETLTAELDREQRWDWDGDGEWDSDWSSATEIEHAFSSPGRYWVILATRSENTSLFDTRPVYVFESNHLLDITTDIDEEDEGATTAVPGGSGLSLREAIHSVR